MPQSLSTCVFFVGLIAGWVVRLRHGHLRRRNGAALERGSRLERVLVVLAVIAMHVLPAIYALTPRLDFANYDLPRGAGPLGAALFAAALWLFRRSHADLGSNWSPVPRILQGQSLVTEGVYRRIRHPMYAAHWLGGLAQALLIPNWLAGFGFLAVFLPIYLLRVGREEQMMLEHFGEPYRQYMARTGQLVPRLW